MSPPWSCLALALGNVQGLGYLAAQGYRVPVNRVSVAVGAASIVNALLGGHQASVGRAEQRDRGRPRGRSAGPALLGGRARRSGLALVIAAARRRRGPVVGALPAGFVAVVTGLALLPAFQDALERAMGGLRFRGRRHAFVVAATPVQAAGIGSSSWALAGLGASLGVERHGDGLGRGATAACSRRGLAAWPARAVPRERVPPVRRRTRPEAGARGRGSSR